MSSVMLVRMGFVVSPSGVILTLKACLPHAIVEER